MTPEQDFAANELICEKLLGWKKAQSCGEQEWFCNHDRRDATSGPFLTCVTPSFTTWADAGLILDALERLGIDWDIERTETDTGFRSTVRMFTHPTVCIRDGATLFAAIRTAALEYIKAVKS